MISIIRVLSGVLAAFWLVTGTLVTFEVVSTGSPEAARVIGILMIANGVALAAAARLVLRGNWLFNGAALLLFFLNAVLSITDQIGLLDMISLVMNCVLLLLFAVATRAGRPPGTGVDTACR